MLAAEIDHANKPSAADRETNRNSRRDKHLRVLLAPTPCQCSLCGEARTVTFCTEIKRTPISTNNCRIETAATAPSFKGPWARGQRCLIPAVDFDEPYWGTGRNIWWRFARRDGQPWALAGLWTTWKDPATGEVVPSYTMLTQNCDGHPLLGLMHKPDPALPADRQDKRSVVAIERHQWDTWLRGTPQDARTLVQVSPAALFAHGAADPAQQIPLPGD